MRHAVGGAFIAPLSVLSDTLTAMAYVTKADIEAALGTTLTAEQTTYFESVISPGIDAYIDKETETSFGGTIPQVVYVSGNGSSLLIIPTMHTITGVTKLDDSTVVPISEYTLIKANSDDVYAIKHKNATWDDDIMNYTVSGIPGHKAVPADIKMVATELALASLSNQSVNGYKSEKVGDWSVTYGDSETSTRSISTLHSYRRLSRSL